MISSKPRTILARAIRAVMCERFPKCFSETSPQPLKIGIREDIIARCLDIEYKFIKLFLIFYTQNFDYQKTLIEGASRVDLDGHTTGVITLEEAMHARKKYLRSRDVHFKKKRDAAKAEQQANA